MPKTKPKRREPPISVRLTPEERLRLEKDRGSMSRNANIKAKLFDPASIPERKRRGSEPIKDHQLIAKLLGFFGQSQLADNFGALAQAAKSGSLPVDTKTERAINRACADVAAMRSMLMAALGISAQNR